MTDGLRLASNLTLPVEFATEGVAVIGMRGSGKSNTEVRFAELLYDAGVPWVAIDPKGDWHGIRSSADGKKAGLSVPVFGGLHGDFPLEPRTGARIADLLVEEMISAVLDVSAMSKTGELPAFLTAFCKQLMHRHQLDPHVRTVILEEAHRYIPQSVTAQTATLKEAAASLLLEGRAFGLGCWAATQRPARLHKDVLEEVGNVILHRIGPAATNDKRTIAGWVKHYELSEMIVDSLTTLAAGEAWVLLPDDGVIKRAKIERRKTFDSAATPKVGAVARRPATMAEIDQDAINAALADVIEKAKADDPKALHARIRDLERQMAARAPETVEVPVEVPVPVISSEVLERLEELLLPHAGLLAEVSAILALYRGESAVFRGTPNARPVAEIPATRAPAAPAPPVRRARKPAEHSAGPDGIKLGPAERKVLTALAQQPNRDKDQLALLTGYRPTASTIGVAVSALRRAGFIEPDRNMATDAGLAWLGDYELLPTGAALLAYWREHLGTDNYDRKVFDALLESYPHPMSKEDLQDTTGSSRTASTVGVSLSKLRRLCLASKDGHGWRTSEDFMEAIR